MTIPLAVKNSNNVDEAIRRRRSVSNVLHAEEISACSIVSDDAFRDTTSISNDRKGHLFADCRRRWRAVVDMLLTFDLCVRVASELGRTFIGNVS